MKIDKAMVAKVGSMALAVGLLVGNAIKDMLDKREQEELINKLIDDKLNERERMGDDPEDEEIASRIDRMMDIFATDKIYTASGYVDASTHSAGPVTAGKNLVLLITIMIAILITVLMERSFISKETGEIALLKAIGFRTSSICIQHTLRFITTVIISTVIAIAFNIPFTRLISDRIFAIMGATGSIEYKIMPLEVFILYPALLAAFIGVSAFLTSLYTAAIHSSDMGNIE